jgi:hypothetical protein
MVDDMQRFSSWLHSPNYGTGTTASHTDTLKPRVVFGVLALPKSMLRVTRRATVGYLDGRINWTRTSDNAHHHKVD